jgi:hypothetical protein
MYHCFLKNLKCQNHHLTDLRLKNLMYHLFRLNLMFPMSRLLA